MPRPRSVTFLAVWVFSLAVINLLAAVNGLRAYVYLSGLPLNLPPAYLLAAGAAWGLAFLLLGVGLWRLKHWARLAILPGLAAYLGVGWVERLAFGTSDYWAVSAPFHAILHLVGLALVWGVLMRRKVRRAFSA
jgi:hypothetical protein